MVKQDVETSYYGVHNENRRVAVGEEGCERRVREIRGADQEIGGNEKNETEDDVENEENDGEDVQDGRRAPADYAEDEAALVDSDGYEKDKWEDFEEKAGRVKCKSEKCSEGPIIDELESECSKSQDNEDN
jgi:hypothetical protein